MSIEIAQKWDTEFNNSTVSKKDIHYKILSI